MGYAGFRVDEVAGRVGVAKGTIYLDFPGKEHLIDSALEWAAERLVGEVSEAVADVEEPRARLLRAFGALAEVLRQRKELAVLVECRPVRGSLESGPVPCKPLKEFLRGLVLDAKRATALNGAEGDTAAEAILGLLSRPDWRRLAAEVGPEEALGRSAMTEMLAGARG